MEQAHVKPHRRIECAVLVEAEPSQFFIENFTVRLAEITVLDTPIRDSAADAMDELADGGFALGGVLFTVKIFGDDNFRGEHRPRLRHLDIFLLENDLAAVVGDFRGAFFPFDLVERLDLVVAENAFDAQRLLGFGFFWFHGTGGGNFFVPAAGEAGVETSSRASIMVNSGLNFQNLSGQFQVQQKRSGTKSVNIQEKRAFSQN